MGWTGIIRKGKGSQLMSKHLAADFLTEYDSVEEMINDIEKLCADLRRMGDNEAAATMELQLGFIAVFANWMDKYGSDKANVANVPCAIGGLFTAIVGGYFSKEQMKNEAKTRDIISQAIEALGRDATAFAVGGLDELLTQSEVVN